MKIAIVADWLTVYSGAERVIEQMLHVLPNADLFALVDFLEERSFIGNRNVTTSFIQNLPFSKKHYRKYLPLMPIAIESLDLSGYDLVVSSSHAVAKGVITSPDQIHISYVHSPMRYAWDLQETYLKQARLHRGFRSFITRAILHSLRNFDYRSSVSVDHFLCNSKFVANRIWKYYRREAKVIYPPVNTSAFMPSANKSNYYITVSRLVPYKRVDAIVTAFRMLPERTLVVVGDGPNLSAIQSLAHGCENIRILGHVPFDKLTRLMSEARAFVFAAEEDFGISPVEALASGTPVIAYGKGGVLESVLTDHTGLFFSNQEPNTIADAILQFESMEDAISYDACRERAEQFDESEFRKQFADFISSVVST